MNGIFAVFQVSIIYRFHIACVGLEESSLKGLKEYRCPDCSSQHQSRGAGVASPPPPKNSTGTKANEPPRKRSKGETNLLKSPSPPAYNEDDDPIRKQVIEGFKNVLHPFITDAMSEEKIGTLAVEIEKALFEAMKEEKAEAHGSNAALTKCGQRYRSKYRSLQFNLKDIKNDSLRMHVFSGEITPARLVEMSPQDMANEEVAQVIQRVRQQSIKASVIEEGLIESGFVKKTHKGEEPLAPSGTENAKIEEAGGVLSMFYPYADQAKSSTSHIMEKPPQLEWKGKIILPEGSFCNVFAEFLSTSNVLLNNSLLNYLPHNLHISGRIAIDSASAYVKQIWAGSSSRDVVLFTLKSKSESPSSDPTQKTSTSEDKFMNLIDSLRGNCRWAVIAHDPSRGIKDFYLAPIDISDSIDIAQFPGKSIDALLDSPTSDSSNLLLLGIMIVSKPK